MGSHKIHVPNHQPDHELPMKPEKFLGERPLGDPTSALAALIHTGRALMDHIPRWINWEVPDREHGKTSACSMEKTWKNHVKIHGKISEI